MEPENSTLLNGYQLSRQWFDFAFENPEKISPNHGALYFFCIEQCNRLGWKKKFGLPTSMAKDAIGIRSYNTYVKTLTDLIEWGFIEMIEKSKNQHTANIIALSIIDKAPNKALDKALFAPCQNLIKQSESTCKSTGESIDSINKQETNKQINHKEGVSTPSTHPSPKKVELNFPYSSEKFLKMWAQLVEMPKWKKKLPISLQMSLDKLAKFDEDFACELISRAIEGNYQGLVFSDTAEVYEKSKIGKKGNKANNEWNRAGAKIGQILQPESEEKRQKLLKRFSNDS